jgi:hypothetical protein
LLGEGWGRVAYRERSCEMDRIVAAQREPLGQLTGLVCELRIDPDQRQLAVEGLEVSERTRAGAGVQTPTAPGSRERRATLEVGQDAAR